MAIYLFIFGLLTVLTVEYELRIFEKKNVLIIITVLLGLFAGLKGAEVSKDYFTYQRMFDYINELRSDRFFSNYEPGFSLIVVGARHLFSVNYGVAIMLFFAIASVSLKIFSFNKLSVNPFLVILFYYSTIFFLHEMTQIRIGLSASIFFFGLYHYLQGRKLLYFFLILIAASFHYSAILYLLIFALDNRHLTKVFLVGGLIAAVILGFYKIPFLGLIGNIDIAELSPKLGHYTDIVEEGIAPSINVFNVSNLVTIAFCLYLIIAVPQKIITENKLLNLSLKFVVFSIFMLSFLSGIPTISFRVSELFTIMSIFVFASLQRYLPFKKWNIFITVGIAGLLFYISVFHGDLVKPYSIIEFK